MGLAILVAAASFTLLTASASTSELHVRGTLTKNFRGAYDILVRPNGSFTPLEREQGLVRDNYLSGIYGGITRRQYEAIKRIPGVAVAAPIANIGTVFVPGRVTVPLARFLTSARDQLFRVRFSWRAQRGLSHYPGGVIYVYVTHRRFLLWPPGSQYASTVVDEPGKQQPLSVCQGFGNSQPAPIAPFAIANSTFFTCFSTSLSADLRALNQKVGFPSMEARNARVVFAFNFPVSLAAIDPLEETKLVHLKQAMVAGRYLDPSMRPRRARHQFVVPVIASSHSVVDEQLVTEIQRLRVPGDVDLPALLAAGACRVAVVPCPQGDTIAGPPTRPKETAYAFVSALPAGPVVGRSAYSAATAYRGAGGGGRTYWTGGSVRYRRLGPDLLEPLPAINGDETWIDDFNGQSGYYDQPSDNLDVQFRHLVGRRGSNLFHNGLVAAPGLRAVGRFDPRRLPGFSALSQVPLETYYPPRLAPADARTSKLLRGKPLAPSQNIGDYVSQPPLLLTNLAGLQPFLDDARFGNLSPRQQRAPISVIRIRIAGVTGPDKLSQVRIKTVAQMIHERTGLAVDITAGSSPTPITIALPAGKFGRPPLLLEEGWVKKGVAVAYLRALDRKDLALFALILVVCAFFLGNGAFASVRTRRAEIGALSTLGWSPAEIFRVVLGELALIGFVAGLLGSGLAASLVAAFSLHLPLARTLYVLPIAVALSLVSGLVPAWRASRVRPLDAILPPVTGGGHGSHVRGILGMAWVNLRRLPGRTAVGAAGLALGVAALTVLVGIEEGFRGSLVGTVLGSAVSVEVHGADFVALGLTIGLSALSAADVLYLNLRERQAELVTLETLGWSDAETRRLVALEALLLAVGASLAGAAVGVLIGVLVLGVGVIALLIGAAIAGGVAALAAFVSSLLPLLRLRRLTPPEVLAAE